MMATTCEYSGVTVGSAYECGSWHVQESLNKVPHLKLNSCVLPIKAGCLWGTMTYELHCIATTANSNVMHIALHMLLKKAGCCRVTKSLSV